VSTGRKRPILVRLHSAWPETGAAFSVVRGSCHVKLADLAKFSHLIRNRGRETRW